ncbi:MAG: hypothetical protein WAT09_09610 [Paracoccaceae bacterium]
MASFGPDKIDASCNRAGIVGYGGQIATHAIEVREIYPRPDAVH